jgi:tRNA dimethylallyltransferase
MRILPPLLVILGPTASGKTGLALDLARKFQGELVNADSRQIYKGMDIGTNKTLNANIKKEEIGKETIYLINGIPLHLIDLVNPDQEFTLAEYKTTALRKINEIHMRNKLPILVGGTGLYVSAIADNLSIPKAPPDKKLRNKLEEKDAEKLYKALKKIDPGAAESIGQNNKRKLIRALEVCKATGQPFSSQQKKGKPLFRLLEIGVEKERKELYEKIDKRVDEMIKAGLIKETEKLLEKYDPNLPAMSGIGYKEIGLYLHGELSQEEAVQKIKWHTHQYARRQITWFKRDPRIHWIKKYEEAEKLVRDFI